MLSANCGGILFAVWFQKAITKQKQKKHPSFCKVLENPVAWVEDTLPNALLSSQWQLTDIQCGL